MQSVKFLSVLFLLLSVAFPTFAQTSSGGDYDLRGHSNGASTSSGGSYTLVGAVGQPLHEDATGSTYRLSSGFLALLKGLFSPYDMDYNNLITPEDAIYVINRIGQAVTVSTQIADVNADGVINSADVDAITQRLGQTLP